MKAPGSGVDYRPDIDGLRALAVLAVVAYHYAPVRLPGGFVGVDIFFVISGYLITKVLISDFEAHVFSLLVFYKRRIHRIFPALILILALCLLVGWFLLFPTEYARLGKSVAGGAWFVENFVLWQEAGYFDTDAVLKPLLHLWSLAVEEQFYIFWPLILWFSIRRRWPLTRVVALTTLLSFLVNLLSLRLDATAAFYLLGSRAWELMAGAWLAARHHAAGTPGGSNVQACAGLLLIGVGVSCIRPWFGFPGYWALLPVLGSALLISAGPGAWINRHLLARKPMVWVGLISYPLYLWHWTLWSLITVVFDEFGNPLKRIVKVAALAAAFLLSWGTYVWLEKPIRRQPLGRTTWGLLFTVLLLGAGGLSVYLAQGLPGRGTNTATVKQYLASVTVSPLSGQCFGAALLRGDRLAEQPFCEVGDVAAPRWVLAYGDSHARSLLPALDAYGKAAHVRVVFAALPGCLSLVDFSYTSQPAGDACARLGPVLADKAWTHKASAVVLIDSWINYVGSVAAVVPEARFRQALRATLDAYQAHGIPVLLLEDNPHQRMGLLGTLRFGTVTDRKINASAVSLAEHRALQAEANRLLEALVAGRPLASVLSLDDALCQGGVCPWVRAGRFLYFDSSHLSVDGARQVYPALARRLDEILR